jgi:glucosamine 6-phosphate synthetase-like amidotransferase/phosphosugar isomerase protein
MCGIIGYFGDTGGALARVLGAMASIIYRAPDSTGMAWFGDQAEPIRIRKTVGALSRFVETQLSEETHTKATEILVSLLADEKTTMDRAQLQRALLRWEGLPEPPGEVSREADYHDLVDEGSPPWLAVLPGSCGAPKPKAYRIESAEDLKSLILDGIEKYDLPPLVVRTLAATALRRTLRGGESGVYGDIEEKTAVNMFDELYRQSLDQLDLVISNPEPEMEAFPATGFRAGERTPDTAGAQQGSLFLTFQDKDLPEGEERVRRQFNGLLGDSAIRLPRECSPDAVGWLFRLLDGSLLSRLSINPEIREGVQRIFVDSLPEGAKQARLPWTTVYLAEEGLNVFGRAAASAWMYLRTAELPSSQRDRQDGSDVLRVEAADFWKDTNPEAFRYFCSPVIAHGRWALQSPVSDQNAHPFLDAEGRRAIVLNGQFSPEVEEELRDFLTQMGYRLRSQNSTEYLSILWGHYYDLFRYERRRGKAIQRQVESGLDQYNLGNQTIDYRIFSMIKDRSPSQLDALAFREAAGKMAAGGGQIGVAGISLYSPHCLFVASHDRPLFLVRRVGTEQIMVVSDINASLGLFSQKMIQEKARELKTLRREYNRQVSALRGAGAGSEQIQDKRKELKDREDLVLEGLRVWILPIEGEGKFAVVETTFQENRVQRRITVTDFNGQPIEDIESFETTLDPLLGEMAYASFFETHLKEIPERMRDMLSAYLPEGTGSPRLRLRRRLLLRRFGPKLAALERVVLVGMGSSYHAGLMARTLCRELLPDIEVLLLRPVEVEHALRLMEPEKDLVVLISWSGATADMVEFARELETSKISFIVVTNKPYSELGLLAWRSLGVMNLVSGEEVTFSAVKSTCCVLFGIHLLVIWLAELSGRDAEVKGRLAKLISLPHTIEGLLDEPQLMQAVSRWARENSACCRGFVFDDLLYANTGREAAWKLEENGRRILCRVLDYRDPFPQCLGREGSANLVIVNATGKARLGKAIELMKRLFLSDVQFYCVSYDSPRLEQVRFYSRDKVLILPKVDDAFQPLVDLTVYYRFVQRLIEESGRGIPGFPRNRVKSVTTTRSRQKRFPQPANEQGMIRRDLEKLTNIPAPDLSRDTSWENLAHTEWERKIYKRIRDIATLLAREDPLEALFPRSQGNPDRLYSSLFDELSEGGEVVFLCCDRTSWAAGFEAAAVWGRLLQVPLRIFYRLEDVHRKEQSLPIIVVASETPDRETLESIRRNSELPFCWVGPELESKLADRFRQSLGYYVLEDDFPVSAHVRLYTGILLLLSAAWQRSSPEKSRVLLSLMCSIGKAVAAVLEDESMKKSIDGFWAQNNHWDVAFYISPPSGIGYVWEQIFDATGALSLEHHVYGDSAHGPIATVDPQPEVSLAPVTGAPEQRCCGNNLIILDATRARYLEQARDEVEVFSCRAARLLLISQRAFGTSNGQTGMFAASIAGEPVLLPELNRGSTPIPDLHLPVVSSLMAVAFAAACLSAKGVSDTAATFTSREETRQLFHRKLLLLGDAVSGGDIDLSILDHRQLAALQRLAPLVRKVENVVCFEVRRFASEKKLEGFVKKEEKAADITEIVDHFRIVQAQGLSFYLMKEHSSASQSDGGRWQEVFGLSWEALSSATVQIGESQSGRALIEVPLLAAPKREGWLLRLFVNYLEWDHTQELEAQLGETLDAMQKGLMSFNESSPGYLTMVSRFNQLMQSRGQAWADWLIALVPRSWLLYKPSLELAELLADRCSELLKMNSRGAVDPETIRAALDTVWRSLTATGEEPLRWRRLSAKMKRQLRGGKP